MRKLMIGTILSVAFACGIFLYTEWENKRFTDSLPQSPVAEQQTVDAHPHSHPHPHEHPAPATDSNTGALESETGIIENSISTEPMAEDDVQSVNAERHTIVVEQAGEMWQTDGAHEHHEHKSSRSPFARKLLRPEDMDPDELADMILKGLIQRFGDIPEVHTFVEIKRKMFKNDPINWDERIAYTTAQYHLWPHPETKKTLEILLEKRDSKYPRSTRIVR